MSQVKKSVIGQIFRCQDNRDIAANCSSFAKLLIQLKLPPKDRENPLNIFYNKYTVFTFLIMLSPLAKLLFEHKDELKSSRSHS